MTKSFELQKKLSIFYGPSSQRLKITKLSYYEIRLFDWFSNTDATPCWCVKVRLDRNITDNGRTELEAFSRAQMASASCKVPLMVHHTNSNIKLESGKDALISCPGSLKKGDVYTHTFHGHQSSIYDPTTRSIHPSIIPWVTQLIYWNWWIAWSVLKAFWKVDRGG